MQTLSRTASKELRSVLQEIWHVQFYEDENVSRDDLIMPTGVLHVVFNFGDDCFFLGGGESPVKFPTIVVSGQLDRAWKIRYGKNADQIGLALTPAGFLKLFSVPGALYSGTFLDGSLSPWNLTSLYEELKEVDSFDDAVIHIENYIKEKVGNFNSLQRINRILEIIEASDGNLTIKELADQNNLSISALERYFKKTIGMTPKAYGNIIRFRLAVKMIDDDGMMDHFYDQSHFIKACRKYTGKTPAELIKGNEEITLDYMLKQR